MIVQPGSAELASLVSTMEVLDLLLDQPWHKGVEIVTDYMPPFPAPATRPTLVVRYNNGRPPEERPYLRYSKGPKQCFFWDVYGDDFQSLATAVVAVSKAPAPVDVGPLVFRLQLKPKE